MNTNTLDTLATAGVPAVATPIHKPLTAWQVLERAHSECPPQGGFRASTAWDTLAAFAERVGAPFPRSYRDCVLNASAISKAKQKGGTLTAKLALTDAWKGALEHAERNGRDDDFRAARRQFSAVDRCHRVFGNVEEA